MNMSLTFCALQSLINQGQAAADPDNACRSEDGRARERCAHRSRIEGGGVGAEDVCIPVP